MEVLDPTRDGLDLSVLAVIASQAEAVIRLGAAVDVAADPELTAIVRRLTADQVPLARAMLAALVEHGPRERGPAGLVLGVRRRRHRGRAATARGARMGLGRRHGCGRQGRRRRLRHRRHPPGGRGSGWCGGGRARPGRRGAGYAFDEGPHEDLVGHGTACAGIIRSFAPEAEIYSVRVLGANLKGQGALFLAGIEWAVEQGIDVVNMSLSSKSEAMFAPLHDVADQAYFRRLRAGLRGQQRAGTDVPLAVRLGRLRRSAPRQGPLGAGLQPAAARGVRCPRHRRRGAMDRS